MICEYEVINIQEDDLQSYLNEMGKAGWRLHSIRLSSKPGAPGCDYARCVLERSTG